MIKVTIPDIPPSVNSYWRTALNKKTGRPTRYLSKRAKQWKELVNLTCSKKIHPDKIEMSVVFHLKNHKRRDIDNMTKALLDSFEDIFYKDDKQIYRLTLEKVIDGTEKTEVIIKKYCENSVEVV